jgi:membrane-bound lytic murein transglycosylase A
MIDSKRLLGPPWGKPIERLGLFQLVLVVCACLVSFFAMAQNQPAGGAEARLQAISFSQLAGWGQDDLRPLWPAFLANCSTMRQRSPEWLAPCQATDQVNGADRQQIQQFFETHFTPHALTDGKGAKSATITGYYEPLLKGSRSRGGPYQFPLYGVPPDLIQVDLASVYPELRPLRLRGRLQANRLVPYPSRAEIESRNLLAGLELAWVDDPVEAFFLQVQGSGRIQLPNGQAMRVGYAEQNGHPYRSIGRWLVDRGEMKLSEASMQGIKRWVQANPHRKDELLRQNPSMIFFKELTGMDTSAGPLGSMGLPLTAERSIAVDPRFVAMGTPVFLSTRIPSPGVPMGDSGTAFNQLMLAQDTGSAILGAHRGDIFFGTGDAAGEIAGRMKANGVMTVLLPRATVLLSR